MKDVKRRLYGAYRRKLIVFKDLLHKYYSLCYNAQIGCFSIILIAQKGDLSIVTIAQMHLCVEQSVLLC